VKIIFNQTKERLMKDLKKQVFELLKNFLPQEKQKEAEEALEKLTIDQPKPPSLPQTGTNNEVITAIQAELNAAMETIKQLTTAIAEEKKAREAAQKTIAEQLKAEKEKKIAELIEKAKKDGRLAEADTKEWQELLSMDYERSAKVLEKLPVKPEFSKQQKPQNSKDSKPETKSTSLKNYFDNKTEFNEAAIAAFNTTSKN